VPESARFRGLEIPVRKGEPHGTARSDWHSTLYVARTSTGIERARRAHRHLVTGSDSLRIKCEVDPARADAEASSHADRSNVTEEPVAKPAAAPEGGSTPATPAPVPGPSNRREAASAARGDDARPGARHFYSDALGDSLFIAGLGASGVGGFLLITGNSDMKASRDLGTDSAAQRAADSAHGKQVTGAVLLPIGGALLVGGIIRWATNSSSEASNTSGLVVGPQYVGYSGQF